MERAEAAELVEAEKYVHQWAEETDDGDLLAVMAEYDRRGKVEQRARALLDVLSSDEGYDRGFNGEGVERAVQDLARAVRGEVDR